MLLIASTPRSLWSVALEMYQGAFVIALNIFDWNRSRIFDVRVAGRTPELNAVGPDSF